MKVVVTRHKALIDYLFETGVIGKDTLCFEHVEAVNIRNKHVLGILPLHLAAEALSVTEIPLALTREDREKGDLSLSRIREIAGEPRTYSVYDITRDGEKRRLRQAAERASRLAEVGLPVDSSNHAIKQHCHSFLVERGYFSHPAQNLYSTMIAVRDVTPDHLLAVEMAKEVDLPRMFEIEPVVVGLADGAKTAAIKISVDLLGEASLPLGFWSRP